MPDGRRFAAKRHSLSWNDFDALAAGGGDDEVVARLMTAERSRRMLMLRAVLDAAPADRDRTSPLPPLHDAWHLLAEAQRVVPAAAEAVLRHPQLGTWAGTALRTLTGGAARSEPLWVELAYLHSVAAAAAVRAGVDFTGRLLVHQGAAVLPTLGYTLLDISSEWDVVPIRSDGGRVRIGEDGRFVELPAEREADAPGWYALRRLEAEADGLTYRVVLDEIDPYRESGRVLPPRRMDPESLAQWRRRFQAAWTTLVRGQRDKAVPLAAGLSTIVPRAATRRFRTFSATAEESLGSAGMSLPADHATLAMTLLHELQHTKLGAVLHLVSLYEGAKKERLYAPWRPDPRPAPGLLQGVYAFLTVADFWRVERYTCEGDASRFAQLEFAHWRRQTWAAWQQLRTQPGLTELGQRFVGGMGARMAPWQDEPVPPDLLALADSMAGDHWATWRIRNVKPAGEDVDVLADAWLDGRPQPGLRVRETVGTAGRSVSREGRAMLVRLRAADPPAFQEFLADPSPDWIGDLVPGDIAYVTGDHAAAVDAYREQIETDPNRTGAWVGLGLSLLALGRTAAGHALLTRPELVRAVYRELRIRKDVPPPPDAVALWLGS